VLLAGLPWAARRLVGPAGPSTLARVLRACGYAAILALVVAKASAERFGNPPSHENEVWPVLSLWTGEVLFLAMMVIYAGWTFAATARRSPATPARRPSAPGARDRRICHVRPGELHHRLRGQRGSPPPLRGSPGCGGRPTLAGLAGRAPPFTGAKLAIHRQ
jgi:hypothetical protein